MYKSHVFQNRHKVPFVVTCHIWLLKDLSMLKQYKTKEFEHCIFANISKINISDIRLIPLDHDTYIIYQHWWKAAHFFLCPVSCLCCSIWFGEQLFYSWWEGFIKKIEIGSKETVSYPSWIDLTRPPGNGWFPHSSLICCFLAAKERTIGATWNNGITWISNQIIKCAIQMQF